VSKTCVDILWNHANKHWRHIPPGYITLTFLVTSYQNAGMHCILNESSCWTVRWRDHCEAGKSHPLRIPPPNLSLFLSLPLPQHALDTGRWRERGRKKFPLVPSPANSLRFGYCRLCVALSPSPQIRTPSGGGWPKRAAAWPLSCTGRPIWGICCRSKVDDNGEKSIFLTQWFTPGLWDRRY